MSSTRRDFLKQAAELSALLMGSIERAAAIEPATGSTFQDAEHVVILMQENRSFDHTFGTLRGVRGFNDPRAVTLPNGKPVWEQSDKNGRTFKPFRLDMKGTKATWLGSLPHSWRDQSDARNDGNHDRWLDTKMSGRKECAGMPLTMGFYDRQDIPFYYALADAFTVCDQNFCSSLTGTTPNRLHLWTGTIRDAEGVAKVRNSDVDYKLPARWTTYPERLEDAGVSWRIYQNELSISSGLDKDGDQWLANFTDNPIEWFEQYHADLHETHREFLKETSAKPMTARERSLHDRAFTTNKGDRNYRKLERMRYENREMLVPAGDVLYQFRKDVSSGKLPKVSWLVAPEKFSDHPSAPWYGAWYLAETLNILTQNPEVWKKTVFILTYDENDGYFDHHPPFVAPDPARPETGKVTGGIDAGAEYWHLENDRKRAKPNDARGGPIGLGYRVPMVVASPWSRGGYVCSQVFDHTSVLQLLEKVCGVKEPNITAWRRTVCGDLSAAFRPFRGEAEESLPYPKRDEFLAGIHKAQFQPMPAGWESGRMPKQESGTRKSVALPYELAAEGSVRGDGLEIVLEARDKRFGKRAAGSGFHVYTPGLYRGSAKLRTRAYAVEAGKSLTDSWALDGFAGGRYDLRVLGPNGFYREFRGGKDDPGLLVSCEYESKDVFAQITNRSDAAITVQLKDMSYGSVERTVEVKAGSKERVKLALTERWYDIEVTLGGYARRYAGRIETGEPGISDPAMA